MARKYKLALIFFSVAAGCLWLVRAATASILPSEDRPLVFYSSQMRSDFRQTVLAALQQAQESIHVTMYAITDEKILHLLHQKANAGVQVKVFFDKSATSAAFQPPIAAQSVKAKGLMHRKVIVVDHKTIFLGSANLTTSSLMLHGNLSVGLKDLALAAFLEEGKEGACTFSHGRAYLLPHPEALTALTRRIDEAKSHIHIAMFTLTHPALVDALIRAQDRSVPVTVALDYYTAKGASAKAVKKLQEAGLCLFFSQGSELLHHKWALIDDALVLGSTNWTKAAFEKNHDILLVLDQLDAASLAYIKKLWDVVIAESVPT